MSPCNLYLRDIMQYFRTSYIVLVYTFMQWTYIAAFAEEFWDGFRHEYCYYTNPERSEHRSTVTPDETPASRSEQSRERRLAGIRARRRERLESETAGERETRLATRRARDRVRRRERQASETAEEREVRLSRRRAQYRARRSTESAQAREARLQHVTTTVRLRRAAETPGERWPSPSDVCPSAAATGS